MIHSCSFTGHRDIPEEKQAQVYNLLIENIINLAENGCVNFNTGGALGFDTMAALAVLEVKNSYPDINLNLYLPFPGQGDRWSAHNQKIYRDIKSKAGKVVYSATQYTPSCMYRRNRALIDNADFCIAYCERASGGSARTLKYAAGKDVDFINLALEV